MTINKIITELKKAEIRLEKEAEKLKEIRFELELTRCHMSNWHMRYGTIAEQEILSHPQFPALQSRLMKVIVD